MMWIGILRMIFNLWLVSIGMDRNEKSIFIDFSRISLTINVDRSTGMMDEKIYQRQITKQALADSFMVVNLMIYVDCRTVKDQVGIVSHWKT